jgi:hypothetical protein
VIAVAEANTSPGRVCPLRYRYGARALAAAPTKSAETLYVVGGLYGNVPALDAVEAMANAEPGSATLCFNGDFNWFNISGESFAEINARVSQHDTILGNVEAEFDPENANDDAGCGCAYPDNVDTGIVERSNQIHAQLKATARRHSALAAQLAALPMFARYQVGDCRIGVVHGDADSLAGWRFDVDSLDNSNELPWLQSAFAEAQVDLFASTHTCLPAMRKFALNADGNATGYVVNNGAAGMPNFAPDTANPSASSHLFGLCTRIGVTPSPHETIDEFQHSGAYVALLPIRYDNALWTAQFLKQWPEGSAAHKSYFQRISAGTNFARRRAHVG